jgi:hypothetical protein
LFWLKRLSDLFLDVIIKGDCMTTTKDEKNQPAIFTPFRKKRQPTPEELAELNRAFSLIREKAQKQKEKEKENR